ncbi:DNA polymerase [Aliiroseovarius crassostreae]|uniref:Type-4 uracil-DNA glycosylase n=1 Tax=Aliiroseovarius crassostreae TaxID=154981 RepID=A0A0P7IIT3_9RHOB|nr:uracil-DNA glycosylase [Aliiroseovarius crassostreae]KPN63744.1 uracil-DNA glycosylase [Aliiroseovarius crassostreae]SFU90361.1 DNA polymerase [Aliiroseovarius crassostreae]
MESPALSDLDWHIARAHLDWQVELGVTDAICDAPINRYELEARKPKTAAPTPLASPPARVPDPEVDWVARAKEAAARAQDLEALRAALEAFDGCDLKKGARNTVLADGNPAARVMIIGEAPGRDEDIQGKPFVGRAGGLLDRMFAAINMGRTAALSKNALYITNVMPWRPPQNRDPSPEEMAMMVPFLQRHVQLVAPELIVLMGNTPCQAVLGKRGITRMRGRWEEAWHKPVLPMFHPAYLLRNPAAKREAWADLLELQARLRDL